jgi:hypothetical protein
MSRMIQPAGRLAALLVAAAALMPASTARAQSTTQANDTAYTRLIKEYLQDSRISTELVDHLPASATVPTPLKFNGRIVGTPGELTYASQIHKYMRAIADASPRAKVWTIGQTEEGREMIVAAIADEETIRNLDAYKGYLNELTDPRKTSEARAQEIINKLGKPIYWVTAGMHSGETGGPEMLQELAYRLVVEETPFIQDIRKNLIVFITPVIEVDGREKQVDTYYFNKERPEGEARLPLVYWGKYVAHDDNRDGMGQFLDLTKNITKTWLEWTPTILHDLHEAQSYLYASTGTGPYNEAFDAITIDEWWTLAENEVIEMAKRGVPGVWTYGFYDGWTPNYMFTIAHAHNGIGRFYEVASYGPDNRTMRVGATTTSREWFRPNPPLPTIEWGPRNNTNIQESALLFSLKYTADRASWFLENYWLKGNRQVQQGKDGPINAWVFPADQRRKADVVDAVNDLMRQGLEFNRADADFTAGGVQVHKGDFVVRADQPFRIMADMYFSLQQFSLANPRPYDDTGWTFQLQRDLVLNEIKDKAVLQQAMTPVTYPAKAPGGITGNGAVIVVDNTADNNLMTFRMRNAKVRMLAAEKAFDMAGHHFGPGAFIIPQANRTAIQASLSDLGLSAWAGAMPDVPTHEMDVPRIGYIHSWQRTQDEGWVRAAMDTYGVPYTYFGDNMVAKQGDLRKKYDVILLPQMGGSAQSQVNGMAMTGKLPLPYKKTDKFPSLGAEDQSEDIRGGMGFDGLVALARFVQDGGTLIVEGSTSNIFPSYGLTPGVSVDDAPNLIAPGSIHRGVFVDKNSPLAYGYAGDELPVYFKGDVVLSAGGGRGGFGRGGFGGGGNSPWQNTTPMATLPRLSPWQADTAQARGRGGRGGANAQADEMEQFRQMARQFGLGGGNESSPRVVLKFPDNPQQILLSGTLDGGEALAGKAQVLDEPVGKGHVVMFAIRPYWRWQTQGTFTLGFNAILNWNDLDAGKAQEAAAAPEGGRGR